MIKAVKKVLFRLQNSRPHSINPLPNTLHVNLHAATRLHAVCPAQHLPRLMAGTLSLPFVSETNDFCYISRRLISVKNRCLLKFVFNRIISWLGLEIHDPPPCRGYGLDTELPTKGEAVMCWAEQGRSTPLALIPSPNSTHHHHTGSDSIPHHSTSLPQPCFLISNKDLKKKKAYKEKKAGSYSVLIITKRNCILPSYWNLPQGSVVVFLVFCKKEKKKKKTENSNSQCSADVKLKEESCRSLACFHNRSRDHLSGDTGHNSTGNCETHSVVKVQAESLLHMGKCNISSLSLDPSSLDTINVLIIG